MEEQKADASVQQHDSETILHDSPLSPATPRPASLSSSEPTLRFPRPQGNRQLASWISSSQPNIMSPAFPPSLGLTEDSGLSESTYEFINTDDESQDGQTNESIRSFDYSRADDVQSLAGTERSSSDIDTESESDDDEQVVQLEHQWEREQEEHEQEEPRVGPRSVNPSTYDACPDTSREPSPAGRLPAVDQTPTASPSSLAQSIEFTETEGNLHLNQVAVKHTIRDLSGKQAAAVSKDMELGLGEAPDRLMTTIRQTMAQQFLSSTEPLRVMYTGSPTARDDIIDKISSALMVSASEGRPASGKDKVRNVPVSAPGSTQKPEVELTKASQYQIKVGTCTSAQEVHNPGSFFPDSPDYSITVDGQAHDSIQHPVAPEIEPPMSLPHLGIFYVTENDNASAVETRHVAWKFMNRHGVPCIFISHTQTLNRPAREWGTFIDKNTIHLCLEAPQRKAPRARLPVDLATFLSIDARQMNRNLAYLTNLYRRPVPEDVSLLSRRLPDSELVRCLHQLAVDVCRGIDAYTVLRAVLVWTSIFAAMHGTQFCSNWLMGGNSTVLEPAPSTTPSLPHLPPIESQSTAIINLTTTISSPVKIPRANSPPGNSAIIPFSNLIPEIIPDSPKETVCSIEVYGHNEILVKIPLSTKTTWLAKDSITIDVLRDGEVVKTKFSTIDEGLLIEVPKAKAYGVISVTIVTSRKPKVNETFDVDFGKSLFEEAFEIGRSWVDEIAGTTSDAGELVFSMTDAVLTEFKSASTHLIAEYRTLVDEVKDTWWPQALVNGWTQTLESHSRELERVTEKVGFSLLRAQITSRLWWLKMQGKTKAHDEYRRKAETFLAARIASSARVRTERRGRGSEATCALLTRFWGSSQKCSSHDD